MHQDLNDQVEISLGALFSSINASLLVNPVFLVAPAQRGGVTRRVIKVGVLRHYNRGAPKDKKILCQRATP